MSADNLVKASGYAYYLYIQPVKQNLVSLHHCVDDPCRKNGSTIHLPRATLSNVNLYRPCSVSIFLLYHSIILSQLNRGMHCIEFRYAIEWYKREQRKKTLICLPLQWQMSVFLSVSLLYHSITCLNYILSRSWTLSHACLSNGICNRCILEGIALLPHIHKNLYSLTFCPSRRTLPMSSSFSHTKSPEWFWISIFHFCSCLIRPPHSATHSTCIILNKSFHLVFCLPLRLFPGTSSSVILLRRWPSSLLLTRPYHVSFVLILFATDATFTGRHASSFLIIIFLLESLHPQ